MTIYTCDLCGHEADLFDWSDRTAGTLRCENGHYFCESHMLRLPFSPLIMKKVRLLLPRMERNYHAGDLEYWAGNVENPLKRIRIDSLSDDQLIRYLLRGDPIVFDKPLEEFDLWNTDMCGDIGGYVERMHWYMCPICLNIQFPDQTILRYLLHKCGISRKSVEDEMAELFLDSTELEIFLDSNVPDACFSTPSKSKERAEKK